MSLVGGRRALVVKVSGSLVYPPDPEYIRSLADSIVELYDNGYTLGVVVGGGSLARELIGAARSLNVSGSGLDILGIEASRLNALLLAFTLYPRASPRIPRSMEEALDHAAKGLIPVLGGLQPGQSTNAVAMVLAEAMGASLVINCLRGVGGVYDRDPGEPGARLLERITLDDLWRIVQSYPQVPGAYKLIDHVAIEVARRSRIRIVYADCRDPSIIPRIALGERIGTLVEPGEHAGKG